MSNLFLALVATMAFAGVSFSTAAADKTDQAKAEYDAAKARADASYNASRLRCKDFSGNDRDVCMEKAKATFVKAKADAKANYEGTGEAKLEAREDAIEADYKVAKEKCDSLAGDAKDVCVAEAKEVYAKKGAAIEAREESMEADYTMVKARCNTLSGDARQNCLKEAKVKYDN